VLGELNPVRCRYTALMLRWNNQVIQMMNCRSASKPLDQRLIALVVYLAHLTNRIPILPSFRWNHNSEGQDVAVSEIFDLHQLSSSLNDMSVVEMHEVKGTTTEPERLKRVRYDGEHEQYKRDSSAWTVGGMIPAEEMGDDEVGCWSMYGSKGETPHQAGYDLYKISEHSALITLERVLKIRNSLHPSTALGVQLGHGSRSSLFPSRGRPHSSPTRARATRGGHEHHEELLDAASVSMAGSSPGLRRHHLWVRRADRYI
jgi:hypothetical protein